MNSPNQLKAHKAVSYLKSFVRIAGCVSGMAAFVTHTVLLIFFAFGLLGVAELLGVIEEMVVE